MHFWNNMIKLNMFFITSKKDAIHFNMNLFEKKTLYILWLQNVKVKIVWWSYWAPLLLSRPSRQTVSFDKVY